MKVHQRQGLGKGKIFPAESAQEMVRKNSRCIPHGYIGDYVDRPKDTDLYSSSLEIPIIDFSLQFNVTFWEKKKNLIASKR